MRKLYLDNIRWITVVLVVIYHVIYMFNGVERHGVIGPFKEIQYQDVYQYIVYPWFMLLLFVVSGMSARFYLENHTDKEFRTSRTVKLLVPSTIGLFVFQWILGYYNTCISGVWNTMSDEVPGIVKYLIMVASGTGVLWYIQLLWVFSMLLLVVRKLEKDRLYHVCSKTNLYILLLLTVAIWGAAQVLNTPVVTVYRFGIYGLGFFIGYYVFSHNEVMERLGNYWIPLVVAAVVIGILFVKVYWGQPYAEAVVLKTFLCNVYAWIAVLAILAFMKVNGNFENPFSIFMKKKAWGLYVFHYLPLAMCAYYLHIYLPDMLPVLHYLLVTVSAFAGSFLFYEIISRIPVLRFCVLGIRKK